MVILQLEVSLETVYHTIALCASAGVPVILNPRPADPALDVARIRDRLDLRSERDRAADAHLHADGNAGRGEGGRASLLAKGLQKIIVTLGEKGSLLLTKDEETLVPPFRVQSTDTTGAGDAFIGCFAAYFVETGDIRKAMETANRYAALSTTKPGHAEVLHGPCELREVALRDGVNASGPRGPQRRGPTAA